MNKKYINERARTSASPQQVKLKQILSETQRSLKRKEIPQKESWLEEYKRGFPLWDHPMIPPSCYRFEKGALSCGIIHFSFKLTKNDRFVVFKTFGLRPHQTFEGSKKISKFPIWRSIVLPSEFNRYQLLYIFRFLILRSVHSHQ